MIQLFSDLQNITGKWVLIRASLNVPISGGKVQDDWRIQKALPTFQNLSERGAKTLIVSHLSGERTESLYPVFEYLKKYIPSLIFVKDIFSLEGENIFKGMKDGDIALCENIRQYDGEEKNDPEFAQKLRQYADLFINDDFTVSHRTHATIVELPRYMPSYMGPQFEEEFTHLSQVFNPPHPAICIIGGAKPETKIPLIARLVHTMDRIFVGGISANVLLQKKGFEIGRSVTTQELIPVDTMLTNEKIVLPTDMVVATGSGENRVEKIEEILPSDIIVDAGPEMVENIATAIHTASFVLWNGPLGDYEKGYYSATLSVAEAVSSSSALSVVGGGDTEAALTKDGKQHPFTLLSTAGGAMMDFLSEGTLPGLEALKNSNSNR